MKLISEIHSQFHLRLRSWLKIKFALFAYYAHWNDRIDG